MESQRPSLTSVVPDKPRSEGNSALALVRNRLLQLFDAGRGLYVVFVRTLHASIYGRFDPGAIAHQMYEIGNRSLVFLCVVMGFIGMILVYQAGIQTERVVHDLSMLGATYLELLVRDLGASLCALLLATRVGAGIAAEIGSMVVTEQVDALRMCAADPIDYLIKPRFIASLFMTLVLVIVAGSVAYATGMWAAHLLFNVNPRTFINTSLLDRGDVYVGLIKCLAYGAAIPIISGYCGLTTYGGSEGVGWATTRAVVNCSLAVIMLNFLISGVGFFVFR